MFNENLNRSRSVQKKFFVTEKENKLIKRRMEEANILNFSLYSRYMLLTGQINVIDFEELRELRVAINRIGVNVNQIAKKVNEDDQVSLQELSEVLHLLKDIQKEVLQITQENISKYENKEFE